MKRILTIMLFICFLGLPFAYADQYVEEDQAAVLIVGPFLDDSDLGEETGLTPGTFTIYLYKPSASNPRAGTAITATAAAGNNHMAHVNNGYYSLQLTTAQLDTYGDARITFSYTGVLPISHDLHIRPANVFDSLVSGTDYLQGDVKEVNGTAQTANDNSLDVNAILALLDDARGEPGDLALSVNPDLATKVDYLYKYLRNKKEVTATKIHIYDDAGTNKDHTSTISDDGTTFTRGEFGAGE